MIEDEKALDRIVYFSDAVFAIAMTLLGVELRVPVFQAGLNVRQGNEQLWHALRGMGGEFYAFALSFFVLGLFWMAHHRKFRLIRRYDDRLLWANLLFLFSVAFLPFPTAVLGRYGGEVATIFYAAAMAVTGLLSGYITLYAYRGHRLIDPDVDDRLIRHWIQRAFLPPAVFLASIPIALGSPKIAQYVWLLSFMGTFLLGAVYRRHGATADDEG
ncbi:MAG TPA: TMEM175 family protein [Actinomycetota bacterium]|nr:TMEM175 family protein [Actinomycetota bacterium]